MENRADSIFINGTVRTVDSKNTVAEAVAVRDGRVLAVGTTADIKDLAGPGTKSIDLDGRVLLPGLIDAHGHFPWWGEQILYEANLRGPPLGDCISIDKLIAILRAHAAKCGPEDWVVGVGYEIDLLAEQRHPTREDLDQVATDRPVLAYHVSMHVCAANSFALELAGIGPDTPQPAGGEILKDPVTGELTGVLEEFSAMVLLTQHRPELTRDQKLRGLVATVDEYLRLGVTTTQDGWSRFKHLDILDAAVANGSLKNRVVIWLDWQDHLRMLNGERSTNTFNSDLLIPGAAKIFADGSIPGFTGYLTKPYHTPFKGDANYRSYPTYDPEELKQIVCDLVSKGQQVAIHGNGDAAIDDILAAYAAAEEKFPGRNLRHIVVHAQTAREDQLDLMQTLGTIPSFYILHTYYWGGRHRDIYLGPERAMNISPAASALARGMRFTLHCDAPVVPLDPALMMWSAVNRLDLDGDVIGAHQRIKTLQALRATTIDAAYQGFAEKDLGSVEPGKLADFAIADRDPVDSPDTLKDMKISQTVLGGEVVYEA
jgi:predicted amidohydrolase YtcJ